MDERTLMIAVAMRGTRVVSAELKEVQGEVTETAAVTERASKKMRTATVDAGLLGTGFGKLWKASKMAGLGILGAGAASLVAGSNFEQQMAAVKAVTNGNIMDMKRLSDVALHEATVTRFSATQAAEGMYRLGRAGFNANQILQAIPGTLNLAHASSIDMASAAQIQAETLRSFGLQAGKAGMVADVLAKATQGGAMSMQDLGDAIKYFGATAFGTHQGLQNMVGLLKAMALHAVRGSTAGTTLRQALSRLVNPQKQTAKGLQLMNISAEDLNGPKGLKPLPEILGTMYEHMKGLDKVSRSKAISETFGMHALGGMMAIFNQGPKAWKKFIDQMNNSRGTAKKMADTLNDTVQMRLLRLWHTLEAIGIQFYLAFSPRIKSLLEGVLSPLETLSSYFGDLAYDVKHGEWNTFAIGIDRIFHANGKLYPVLENVITGVRNLWTFVKTVVLPVVKEWAVILAGTLYGAFLLITGIMGFLNHHVTTARYLIRFLIAAYLVWKTTMIASAILTKALYAANIILALATGEAAIATDGATAAMRVYAAAQWLANFAVEAFPVIAIITGAILIGVALYELYKHVKWFHNAVDDVFNWIKTHWQLLVLLIAGPIGIVIIEIVNHWHTLETFFVNMPHRMSAIGKKAWGWLTSSFTDAKNWIVDELNDLFNTILNNWPDVWGVPGPHFHHNPFGAGSGGGGGASSVGSGGAMTFVNQYAGGNPLIRPPAFLSQTANSSKFHLAPRVVEPVTNLRGGDNPLIPDTVHATFKVDGKTLVDAYAKAKSDKTARRGG